LGETYLFCQLVELKERLTESGSVRLSLFPFSYGQLV
jgi:hypothetical protein